MKKFKKGDDVQWKFGDVSKYKIIATKEEPHETETGEKIEVSIGNDYIIAKTPNEDGAFGFQHVPMQHLEFII
jgi:uncharacterized protein (UPF0128 family)